MVPQETDIREAITLVRVHGEQLKELRARMQHVSNLVEAGRKLDAPKWLLPGIVTALILTTGNALIAWRDLATLERTVVDVRERQAHIDRLVSRGVLPIAEERLRWLEQEVARIRHRHDQVDNVKPPAGAAKTN